ncbi:MAG: MG2 domain-containing protein [Alistipes putredinis]|nr:MAG: MG2 domain-containing protein [Alistipes putredinis]
MSCTEDRLLHAVRAETFRRIHGHVRKKGVAEKVYLHTDKPYYSAGETVYIKGYVVNALDHRPLSKSNFIYVQLIDSRDQAVQQFKIMRDSAGVFRSQIELPATVPAGRYTLRGFTKWMQNFGEEYFFGSQIEIGNTIDDAVNCKIDYRPQPDGSVRARVAMLDSKFAPIAKCSISYKVVSGGKTRERFATTDSEGCFEFDFTPQHGDLPQIEIQSQNEDYPYERTFDIPLFRQEFRRAIFFPRGRCASGRAAATRRIQGNRRGRARSGRKRVGNRRKRRDNNGNGLFASGHGHIEHDGGEGKDILYRVLHRGHYAKIRPAAGRGIGMRSQAASALRSNGISGAGYARHRPLAACGHHTLPRPFSIRHGRRDPPRHDFHRRIHGRNTPPVHYRQDERRGALPKAVFS